MASGCKSAIGCLDTRVPVRASYISLYKWPESDAEFVKSVAMARRQEAAAGRGLDPAAAGAESPAVYNGTASMRLDPYAYCSPRVVDSYSCRQMYLRSYTFSKRKETVPERTMACLGRVRERAAVFPFLPQRTPSDAGSVGSVSNFGEDGWGARRESRRRRKKKKKKKKKGCAMVRRLQEASCGAVRAIFHRLLSCTTSVEVADGEQAG